MNPIKLMAYKACRIDDWPLPLGHPFDKLWRIGGRRWISSYELYCYVLRNYCANPR